MWYVWKFWAWCHGMCLIELLRRFDPWIEASSALCDMLEETVIDFSVSSRRGKVVVGKRSIEVKGEYKSKECCLIMEGVKAFTFPIVVGSYRSGSIR